MPKPVVPHDCDDEETCNGCTPCYTKTGQFHCSKRCEHADRCECGHFLDLCESGVAECSESTC